MFEPYPLLMRPHLASNVWGGTERLRAMFPDAAGDVPPEAVLGEAWVVAAHRDGVSTIANGTYAGRSFARLLDEFPEGMTGRPAPTDGYPLLIKFIDAARDLSVQVHPHDRHCERMRLADRGKTECWFILATSDAEERAPAAAAAPPPDAPPDALAAAPDSAPASAPPPRILYGLKNGVDAAALRAAIAAGAIDDVVRYQPIAPGDFLYVPAGVVHAILGGTFLCEIQQSSNTTFRLFDWNRQPPRPLHLEEGLAVTNFGGVSREHFRRLVALDGAPVSYTSLTSNPYFVVAALQLAPGAAMRVGESGSSETILVCTAGEAILEGGAERVELRAGATVFLPARLVAAQVRASRETTLLMTRPLVDA